MNKPEDGLEQLKKRGIHAVNGGRHEKRGSYNTLSYFDQLKYIEMLGIYDEKLFADAGAAELLYSPFQEIARNNYREGFAKVNLRTNDLHALKERLESHGVKTNGPVPLSRKKPDGTLLEWELLYAGDHPGELPLPFFIDWGVSDKEREAALRSDGTIARHEAGDLKFAEVIFAVNDGEEVSAFWKKLFDLTEAEPYVDEKLRARCFPLKLGDVTFIFASPLEKEEGAIKRALDENGEHPYIVTLTGAKEERSFTLFGGRYELRK